MAVSAGVASRGLRRSACRCLAWTRLWFAVATILGAAVAYADPTRVAIAVGDTSDPVTPYQYGMFIEPIGTLIARSLWAEMLDPRSRPRHCLGTYRPAT